MFWRNRLKPIVAGLSSQDDETRKRAFEKLREIAKKGLSKEEALFAIKAAASEYPTSGVKWQDANKQLVYAVARSFHFGLINEVRGNFAVYPPSAQAASLNLLGNLDQREATEALADLLDQLSDDAISINLGTLSEEPRHADILFPRVLAHVHRVQLRWPISKLILAHLSTGWKPIETVMSEIASKMIQLHHNLKHVLFQKQQANGTGWIWEDEYREHRSLAALVLDVIGRLNNPGAEAELVEALQYNDPLLKMFAVVGLVRHGTDPEWHQVLPVAESAETRNWLYRHLAELKRIDIFPEKLATREAFAEGEMVNWLLFPTELAQVPDEIELMATIPFKSSEGLSDFYVFRFRTFEPHWAAKNGWIAGVAGPFLWEKRPSVDACGGTFSSFTPWDECSPEEHLSQIIDLLDRAGKK